MVSVDTVYQRVLALANKEQRGYITPQEFNLYANQAQMEILEQYFYDINQFGNLPGNSTEYSDMVGLIDEKLNILRVISSVQATAGIIDLSTISDMYKLGSLYTGPHEIEEINYNEFKLRSKSPLTDPSNTSGSLQNYMYYESNGNINIQPVLTGPVEISYIKIPNKVVWGYVVLNKKALYNAGSSTNFELHHAEENELVYKILGYAGITLKKPDVIQSSGALEIAKVQQEKQG
jgi:hypothetical protein|tara:strand:+ start:223 stop:924 length:702 start_codon:yes stop_codon:yes gene_type:complete